MLPVSNVKINLFKVAVVALLLFVVIYSMQLIREFLNPDWMGYFNIFYDGGWLKDEGRDPGFLTIISICKIFFGNNYEIFRVVIAIYFALFTYFLAAGKLVQYNEYKANLAAVIIAAVSFLIIRFTIQIREGIALTFMLYALRLITKDKDDVPSSGTQNVKLILLIPAIFLAIAASIHSGTLIFSILFVIAIVLGFIQKSGGGKNYLYIMFYLNIVVTAFVIVLPFIYSKFLNQETFFINRFELTENAVFSFGKLVYWFVYGVMIFIVRHKMLNYISESKWSATNKIYFELIAGYLLKALYILIVLFIIQNAPSEVISAFIRLLNLTVCLCLILLAFKTSNVFFIILFSTFILIDQVRTVIEALLVYKL